MICEIIKARKGFCLLILLSVCIAACGDSNDGDEEQSTETSTESDDGSQWDIDALNARLGRGINMGNALDAPEEEGTWGVVLEEEHFKAAADAGFDSVRITVRWSDHIAEEEPYSIDETFLERVDWAVDTALAEDLAVVIDVHHFEDLMADPKSYTPALKAIWEQLAEHYKNYAPTLYFDLLNEPAGEFTADGWNTLAAELVAIVRKSNPYRALIVEPVNNSNGSGILDLELPKDDRLIASFHYYEPIEFTHQNASWVDGSDQWAGTTWPSGAADIVRLKTRFDDIATWQEERGVPVYVGEFGVIDSADQASREAWVAVVVDECLKREWSFAYWMFDGTETGNFGIFYPKTGEMDASVVEAIMDPASVIEDLDVAEIGDEELPEGSAVVLDDFEDTLLDAPGVAALTAAIAAEEGIDPMGGGWFPYANLETEITNKEGTHIVTYEETLADGTEFNVDALVGDWGYEGAGLVMKMDYQSEAYPYAGVSALFVGDWNQYFFDFTNFVAVSFRAKGVGILRADFLSDAVQNGYPEADAWGFHGEEFTLTSDWVQYVLYAEDFAPVPWSPSADDNLTWDAVKDAVFAFQFSVSNSYGGGIHEALEFHVDNIQLHGLTMEDFKPFMKTE